MSPLLAVGRRSCLLAREGSLTILITLVLFYSTVLISLNLLTTLINPNDPNIFIN